ncbi:MAG: HNH endonuclease [Bacteroidia bacterium]
MDDLIKFETELFNLQRGDSHMAPHKPILVLAIFDLIYDGSITENKIPLNEALIQKFKEYYKRFRVRSNQGDIGKPFYHLSNEPFYYLKWIKNADAENVKRNTSIKNLNQHIEYAYLNDELFDLLKSEINLLYLKHRILQCYFEAESAQYFTPDDMSKQLIIDLEREVKYGVVNKNPRLVPIRNSMFRKEVLKLYNYACPVSGMALSIGNICLLEACHIFQFSKSEKDIVTNGIALAPNLHRAYDNHFITIENDYRVKVSPHIRENSSSVFNLQQFHNIKIKLPAAKEFWPEKQYLEMHQEKFHKING